MKKLKKSKKNNESESENENENENENKKLLGLRLKEVRENHNLNQKEMAKQFKVSEPTYARYERGVGDPSYTRILAISELYDISPTWLIKGEGPKLYSEVIRKIKNRTQIDDTIMKQIMIALSKIESDEIKKAIAEASKEKNKSLSDKEKSDIVNNKTLSDEKKAAITSLAYEYFSNSGIEVNEATVKRFYNNAI